MNGCYDKLVDSFLGERLEHGGFRRGGLVAVTVG